MLVVIFEVCVLGIPIHHADLKLPEKGFHCERVFSLYFECVGVRGFFSNVGILCQGDQSYLIK